jgi:hypothetical protein
VKATIILLVACAIAAPALAQGPVGCDKFKWPIDKERATLNGTDLPKLASGDRAPFPLPWAAIVALKPLAEAKLPTPPGQASKVADSFAGFIAAAAPKRAGTYKVTISSVGWIDLVQDGHAVKSVAFSGATGCEGVRKSVKFELAAKPLTIELSGVRENSIRLVISRD